MAISETCKIQLAKISFPAYNKAPFTLDTTVTIATELRGFS